ncbi:MAG: hypothetical protein WCG92_25790 [Hyphomicrobiales bacterium]
MSLSHYWRRLVDLGRRRSREIGLIVGWGVVGVLIVHAANAVTFQGKSLSQVIGPVLGFGIFAVAGTVRYFMRRR